MLKIILIKSGLLPGLAMILAIPSLSSGAPINIEAYTDKAQIAIGERIELTIKISGEIDGSMPLPSTPGHDGFDILGAPLRSSSFSWINGTVRSSMTISYILIPHSRGTFSIGKTTLNFRGETYTTQPVEVAVEGALSPSWEEESEEEPPARVSADAYGRIMISASIDKDTAYMGEPVVYTFSFLRKVRLWETPQYYPPDFTDFWVEDLPKDSRGKDVVVKGDRYIREDIRKVLFPTREGHFVIKSTTIGAQIDPFDRQVVLSTDPLEIDVLPLPESPQDFSGAVGNFTIASSSDMAKVKEGEPVTVRVELAGEGNIKALPQPAYEESEDFRRYEPKDSVEISTMNNMISGVKAFEYLFIPVRGGDLRLPIFRFTFFDPREETFKTVETDEIIIKVAGSERGERVYTGAEEYSPEKGARIIGDIRPIRTKSALYNWNPKVYVSGAYLWILVMPVFILIVALIIRLLTVTRCNSTSPAKRAMTSLKLAERLISSDNHKVFFAEAEAALHNYLLDVLELPHSDTSKDELLMALSESNSPRQYLERVEKAFNTANRGRFSPVRYANDEMEGFLREVQDLIKRWENRI